MMRTAIHLAYLLVLATVAPAADNSDQGQTAIEQKLLGKFVCGPCAGACTFRVESTFECRNYSPEGNPLKQVWELQWTALPPTLVLKCKESTNPEFVDWLLTVNLGRLNVEEFAYQNPGGESLMRLKRMGRVKARVVYGSVPRNEQVAEIEPSMSKETAKAGSTLALAHTGWITLSTEEKRLYTSPQGEDAFGHTAGTF